MDYKRATKPHKHFCDECGLSFDCYADIMRGDYGDVGPAPFRRCREEWTVCEDCAVKRDAFDYACEKADADNKGEKE